MKTALAIIFMMLYARTAGAVQTDSVCDFNSGECAQGAPDSSPTVWGGPYQGFFSCVQTDAHPLCGNYVGFGNGFGGPGDVNVADDVFFAALDDPHYEPTIGYHIACSVTARGGQQPNHVNCNMHQGPWVWYCDMDEGSVEYCSQTN